MNPQSIDAQALAAPRFAEGLGKLSIDETKRCSSPHDLAVTQAREHYDLMLKLARESARELNVALVSRNHPLIHTRKLANAFAWANRALWMAAKEVVRLERMPDDGAELGIIWEILL